VHFRDRSYTQNAPVAYVRSPLNMNVLVSLMAACVESCPRIEAECSALNGTIKRLSHADRAFCSIFASRAAAFICQLSETIARTCRRVALSALISLVNHFVVMTRLPYSALVALRVIFDANLSSALISTRTGCKFVLRDANFNRNLADCILFKAHID
jgi:hypothetical protein